MQNIDNQVRCMSATVIIAPVSSKSRLKDPVICGHYLYTMDTEYKNCFVNFGTVAESRDGENRTIAIPFAQFNVMMEQPFIADADDVFVEYANKIGATFDIIFCFPANANETDCEDFKKFIINKRGEARLALAHFYFVLEALHFGIPTNEMNVAWLRTDFTNLISSVGMTKEQQMRAFLRNLFSVFAMKIIPLTVNEFAHPNDARYRTWREIYVDNCCTRMGTAKISQNFAKYDRCFVFYNVMPEIFTNPNIVAKFRISNVIAETRKILDTQIHIARSAQDSGYDYFQEHSLILAQQATRNILLSGAAVAILSSVEGYSITFNNLTSENINDITFGWLYALLVLHTHVGIIHADIHLQNILITFTNVAIKIGNHLYENKSNRTGRIIDFSRVIINPMHKLAEQVLPGENIEIAKQESIVLIMRYANQTYPNAPGIADGERLLREDFNSAFYIFALLDAINLLMSISTYAKQSKQMRKGCVEFISRLLVICEEKFYKLLTSGSIITADPLRDILLENFEMKKSDDFDNRKTAFFDYELSLDPLQISSEDRMFMNDAIEK